MIYLGYLALAQSLLSEQILFFIFRVAGLCSVALEVMDLCLASLNHCLSSIVFEHKQGIDGSQHRLFTIHDNEWVDFDFRNNILIGNGKVAQRYQ